MHVECTNYAFVMVLLYYTTQVIPEYQRAVIFRLGRVEDGDVKGPSNVNINLQCIL